ncbi:MAG: hypothetical protein EBT86_09585 [Actinobacteria bacterium]|nr:hypothetical protein [Actinomycetota bacterium]
MGLTVTPSGGNLNTFIASVAVVAAGTNQATATLLTNAINNISTVGTGQGVRLPDANPGMFVIIRNGDIPDLKVYPGSGAVINQLNVNEAFILFNDTSLQFFCISPIQWYTIDAVFS